MISNSGHDERGQYSGGAAGDQTGGEWARIKWYSRPWNYVLRHPDINVGAVMAQLAGEAADNNRVGYDQNQRTTFFSQLRAVGWSPRLIAANCEADCSAGVAAIAIAAGHILGLPKLQALSPDIYTGNLRPAFSSAGFSVLTDSKYLTSDDYLLPGDVLLYEGHHTAINLDFGGKTVPTKLTPQNLISAVAAVYQMAHAGRYRYGDSHALPPCSDGIISCDRLIARALYNLGYTGQPKGGITVISMEAYLLKWGFTKITDPNALRAGDIVLMKQNGTASPTAAWHTFVLNSYTNTGSVSKYDMGAQWRIDTAQPFTAPLNEWGGTKSFYCAFRLGKVQKTIKPQTLKKNAVNNSAYLATEILKGRGYKGVFKDGKRQALELNFEWSVGDMAAMSQYKADRTARRANLSVGPYGAGEVGPGDWADLLGGQLPFALYELPAKQRKGTCVLLAQECLRARGMKGADGKALELDSEWGDNTAAAWAAYCAVRKKQGATLDSQKIDDAGWKDLTGL